VVAEERNARLALKAIQGLRVRDDRIVVLHAWSAPRLTRLAPEHSVACHLITPPSTLPVAVTA